ncbi:hypothetical protein ANOM_001949 [Aspergillus nomiae NRRL 13137]|uniref:Rhodopsin domain-containing protein n=1 Tax=Aspergillus nomiae NRRL (strain ATCC 15546 / NRRL 13137 / CBS 260.88 / M93) TaxID=1509407 RepID=A0A0L1JDC3_ASPN3|nr:uncharacterized protein ANOM_001949 [Aspergillus nomiae NRRL 13137]KNG89726.1 hypothetical protein ANOM_001949 [Aspergillus nomiae NRRL 13137]
MADLGFYNDKTFLPEQWTEFGLGVVIVFVRMGVRIRTVGVRGFQGDDYFAFLYTSHVRTSPPRLGAVDANVQEDVLGTNLEIPHGLHDSLTPTQYSSVVAGSKAELAAWYSYTALIWVMKAKMLFLYKRLTIGLWQSRAIKWLAAFCGIAYLAVFLTVTFGCHPISNNWRVYPPPSKQCGLKIQNVIVTCILNVTTDLALLFIPVPLLWKVKTSFSRKLVIAIFLSSGIFVIAASIIRTTLTLEAEPSSITVNRWGIRETFVGVATVNLPILRPLFTKRFWKSGYVEDGSSGHPYGYQGGSESYNMTTQTRKSARRESMKAINESSEDGNYDVYVSTSYNVKVEQKDTREGGSSDGLHTSGSVWEIDKKSIV